MLATLGHWLVLGTMMACVFNIGLTFFAYRLPSLERRALWLEAAHNAAFVVWAFTFSACALIIAASLSNNFSLAYVWENSSRAQPIPFKISALWGGQGGSLLLWTFVLSTYGLLVSRGGRKSGEVLVPAATSVICATTLFFAGMVAFAASPFMTIDGAIPADGRGMNPLLQNYWMQIHPPTLYTGYVGCTVPFAFAVSALLHRRFDQTWVALIRRWVLFTWIVLTIGIVLGGVWAYETLGWGGYWAWDPVENASLMPWLSATAFLHSIMLQGRRGLLKNWNIALVTLTFLLSVFGTFLTRSGVVQSVHSFAESGIGGYFLAFLGFASVGTMILIWTRREELVSDARIENPLSREGAFMLNNYLLLGITLAVLLGTVWPTLSEALSNSRVTVDKSYFNTTVAPLGLCLLGLTGIGPLLPWRRTTWAGVWKAIKFPALWALALSPVLWLLAQWRTGAATAFVLSLFVVLAIGHEFWRGISVLRAKNGGTVLDSTSSLISFNPARYGGYIVHIGIAIMFVGLTGSSMFKIELPPVTLQLADPAKPNVPEHNTMQIGEYILRLDSIGRRSPMPDNLRDSIAANVSVFDARSGNIITSPQRPMSPSIDFFAAASASNPQTEDEMNQQARRPSIRSTPANDLYLVLDSFDLSKHEAAIKAYLNPLVMWIWAANIFFILGTVIAFIPPIRTGRIRSSEGDADGKANKPTKEEAKKEAELVS